MALFLAMLRGINVGGKKVPMAELRSLYEDMKYKKIRTYIQSGNVIFESKETDEIKISSLHAKKISAKFGFEVPVIIRTEKELSDIIKKNPFVKANGIAEERLYVTFLADIPPKELLQKISVPVGCNDEFKIAGREIYLYCPGGYGETKLNNNFFEKKLKVNATTRNWRTCNELLKMICE